MKKTKPTHEVHPKCYTKSLTFGGAFIMSKYSFEEKLEAVLRVVNDGMGYRASAKILIVRTIRVK